MTVDALIQQDQALAATHRAVWALGDYALMAEEVMAPLGPVLVAVTGMSVGHRVLDVAAGSGNISLPAAATGATVISSDLTPELLQRSRARAARLGLTLEWQEANAHALPFPDGEFDIVMSAIGVMFAPDQRCAASEMIRVCRSGGTIAVISWTPDGFFGRMLATIRPYRPALSAAMPPAALWGREDYVIGLLGDRATDISTPTSASTTVVSARTLLVRSSFTSAALANSASLSPSIAAVPHRVRQLHQRGRMRHLPVQWDAAEPSPSDRIRHLPAQRFITQPVAEL